VYDVTPPVLRLWRGGWNGYYLIAFLNPPPPHPPIPLILFNHSPSSFPHFRLYSASLSPPPSPHHTSSSEYFTLSSYFLLPLFFLSLLHTLSQSLPLSLTLLLSPSPFFLLHTSYSNPPSFDTSRFLFLFPNHLPFRLLSLHSFFFPAPFLSPHFQPLFSFCHYTVSFPLPTPCHAPPILPTGLRTHRSFLPSSFFPILTPSISSSLLSILSSPPIFYLSLPPSVSTSFLLTSPTRSFTSFVTSSRLSASRSFCSVFLPRSFYQSFLLLSLIFISISSIPSLAGLSLLLSTSIFFSLHFISISLLSLSYPISLPSVSLSPSPPHVLA
jgi:hypothetical protein